MNKYTDNTFCTAPMLDLSDDHCRFFWRLLTKKSMLYTEMVTTGAVIYSKKDYLLFNESESPLALQLGGSNPGDLAFCAKKAEKYNYQEMDGIHVIMKLYQIALHYLHRRSSVTASHPRVMNMERNFINLYPTGRSVIQ